MAIRSDSGTGVKVALVVFVLTTVFLLVLTIVFYGGKQKEHGLRADSDAALAVFIKPTQQNMDTYTNYVDKSKISGMSVTEYMHEQRQDTMRFVAGRETGSLDDLKKEFRRYGADDDHSLAKVIQTMNGDLKGAQAEGDSLKSRIASLEEELNNKDQEMADQTTAHEQALAGMQNEVMGYIDAGDEYRRRLDDTIAELDRAKDSLRERFEDEIRGLQEENDDLNQNLVVMSGRVNELESIFAKSRLKAQSPELLVDGKVIDSAGSGNRVFINRGSRDHIVLGMSFEVYDSASAIRVDERTGFLPRGKASMRVIQVGPTTSTCRITRSVNGRPVVTDDVIANAVYDPEYRFKFLVHGKFDWDGDGSPSEAEAEYLRTVVKEWGGVVVYQDTLPGDLDFLVLGAVPPIPMEPAANANQDQVDTYIRMRLASDQYQRLYDQAREAQIPILNTNRFFILIGKEDSR